MLSLPFSQAQFFAVFAEYNSRVWPAQVVLVGLGIGCMFALWRGMYRTAFGILAILWGWMALAYHWAFFRAINPAAAVFAVACLVGSAVFILHAVRTPRHRRHVAYASAIGYMLMAFALAGYPAIGWLAGHRYPATPTFGLPCPTTIFTLGALLAALPVTSAWAFAVPLSWSIIGTAAAWQLGVVQDYVLLAAGAASLAILLHSRLRKPVQ